TVEFEIGNGLFERFFGKDVRVLNVARGAVLLWEQTEYTVNADRDYRLIVGQSAIWQRDIHYVFEPFPEQLSTESSRVVKRRLSILRQTPQEMVEILASQDVDSRLVLDYLETHLLALPNSLDLLVSYGGLAMNNNQQERMETFLKAGLDLRPVAVEWHRSYQGLPQRPDTADGLRKTYDALLAESPNDSALHYLRGRVAKDSATRLACFRKAEELDSRNAYPVFARAYELTGLGRFIEAETACEQARKIEPESNKFQVYLRDLRLAVGKVDLVESELARIVQTASGDYVSASLLVALRIRRGDLAGAEAAQEMVLGAVAKQAEEIRPLFVTWAHMSYAYQKGGMDEYARLAAAASETQGASSMRIIHLERGAPAEAVKCMPRDQLRADSLLETSMAWARAGDQAQARACLEEGFKKLCFETDDGARLFALWQADGVKGVAKSITELSIQPRRRRLVCGALAGVALQPLRAKLIGEARRCNFNVEYPHRLVKNCLDAFEQQ
ncbi:MAG: hypothetical protein KAI66_15900, partial [Lentisphaeria bacterium]|nr:hypothetical protein [Lentisphaeria bacterium]